MARLLVLSINYAPELTGFAPHSTAIAEHFASRGHQVDVVTGFPFAPLWRRTDADRGLTKTEHRRDVTVHRVAHFIPRRPSSAVQRALMELTFCVLASAVLLPIVASRRRRPEVVLYVGAQPLLAWLARLVSAICGCPYYVNINDLAVQAAADVGILRPSFVTRMLERLEFSGYAAASGAAVLCGSFTNMLVARGFPRDRIRLLRSPTDLDLFRPVPRRPDMRAAHGISDDAFAVVWAGSMGRKQDLHTVLSAAKASRGSNIVWVLVGDGECKAELVARVEAEQLDDVVRFVPMQPHGALPAIYAAADALLLIQMRAVKDTVIPSKLLTYMAAGRPVLAAVNERSQGAEILRASDGGRLLAPEDPAALLAAAREMAAAEPAVLAGMGRRNRAYAEAHFDQRRILASYEEMLLGGGAAAAPLAGATRAAS